MEGLRVFFVIPGEAVGPSMIHAKRAVESVLRLGVEGRTLFLKSRTSPFVIVGEWRRLRCELRAFAPDIVHAHYGTMTAFLCATAARCPFVVTYRGIDLNPCSDVPWLRLTTGHLLSQLAARRAARIICVSEEVKRRLWWRKDRAEVIPSGVDTDRFYPQPREEARRRLGWSPEERVVLFNAGRYPKRKRLDLAESAIDAARNLGENVRLEIMDGLVEPDIVPILMNAADCLLCVSETEGSPNVVKEALACDLPVVSVDVGDVRERLAGVTLSWIVGYDPQEIGRAVVEILRRAERSNGHKKIGRLSLIACGQRTLDVYRAALRHG